MGMEEESTACQCSPKDLRHVYGSTDTLADKPRSVEQDEYMRGVRERTRDGIWAVLAGKGKA